MKEIGGYIGLDSYNLPMLHEEAVALNCGRNALAYLIRARKIKKIALPYFLCDSVRDVCMREGTEVRYYHIDESFRPLGLTVDSGEWAYIVNYYGQLTSQEIEKYKVEYCRIIVDNAQAYFDMPVSSIDTLYTCRKFFGVADGAFLYTDAELGEDLERDESYKRMEFILGRYERTASEFYGAYVKNNGMFSNEPIKKMSKLTMNLLHGIDYKMAKERRTQNYNFLYEALSDRNRLRLRRIQGAFAYPLLIDNGAEIRKRLIRERVYIPMLWPNVLKDIISDKLEYNYAADILPLPVDQRYDKKDMEYFIKVYKRQIV